MKVTTTACSLSGRGNFATYTAPTLEEIRIAVERGFAGSPESELPGIGDDGEAY